MMNNHLHKYARRYVSGLIIFVIVLAGTYILMKYRPGLVPIAKNNEQGEDVSGEYGFELEVTGEKSTKKTKEVAQIFLESPQDELNVYVDSFLGVDSNFLLKVFYNYKEVDFKVLTNGEDTVRSSYEFELMDGDETNIPVVLADSVHKVAANDTLMVSVFFRPDLHMKDLEETTNFHGGSVVYDLIYGQKEPKQFVPIIDDNQFTAPRTIVTDYFPDSISEGLIVNNALNINMYEEKVPLPPLNLQVKSGEEIELAYVIPRC